MPNNFKLKLSRVIPSSFQLCRSRNPLSLAHSPTPAIYRLSPINPKVLDINYPNLPSPPPTTPNDVSPAKRHLSRKIISAARNLSSDWSTDQSMDFICHGEENKHERHQAKPRGYIPSRLSSYYDDCTRMDMSPAVSKKGRKKENKKDKASILPFDHSGCFSSDAVQEDTETLLFSSSNFSYDSSCEFSQSQDFTTDTSFVETFPTNIAGARNNYNNVRKLRKLGRQVSRKLRKSSNPTETKTAAPPEVASPVMASFFRRITACAVDEKVKESMAIVKKSDDPYGDFKRSMLEMILEKQIFEVEALEELLQCFLSLNSRQYHGVIVQAFSEIWQVLFCDSPVQVQKQKRATIRL
ncbi:hypothetical protein Tsubulata_038813 [Turnera subulata]|uniref:Transcription repressor n=1 Tax=Turnera subulata TaxID=218843 RepID=A0A9Q0F6W6_9ROSI|nr:hypothetical protein Tsubulata_038813 [Turnera subulata]